MRKKRKRESYALLRTIGILYFIVLLFSDAQAQSAGERAAANGLATIKPLEIGDAIPEEIWQTQFTLVKHNEQPRTIKLADYRGKVIILDFWATWCTGCILSMPKMHTLAHADPENVLLLPVTYEDAGLIQNFLKVTASPQIRELKDELETVVSGQILKDLIPHQTIPHIAVINTDGVLELITMPHLLNDDVLRKVATKEEYYIPTYRGKLDTTLLSHTFTDLKKFNPTYYSTLTGYMDGFDNATKEWTDSANNVRRGYFVNRPLLRLFQIALSPNFGVLVPGFLIVGRLFFGFCES